MQTNIASYDTSIVLICCDSWITRVSIVLEHSHFSLTASSIHL